MSFQADLEKLFGLKDVSYKYELSKAELFHEAIAHDRGRVRRDGPDNEQKAYATKLGVDGPLVYYTDPECTGRRTKDTYAVNWPEVAEELWFKPDFNRYEPEKYERSEEHTSELQSLMRISYDVFCLQKNKKK